MYAVVESGGKQYRVEEGTVLVVDRLQAKEGDKVALRPVMVSGDDFLVTAADLAKFKVEATVTEHLRGDKIRVFKYKPKKGYSRRTGHRSELTRLEVTSLGGTKKKATKKAAAKKETAKAEAPKEEAEKAAPKKAEVKADTEKAETKKSTAAKSEPKAAKPKKEAAPKAADEKTPEKKEANDGA